MTRAVVTSSGDRDLERLEATPGVNPRALEYAVSIRGRRSPSIPRSLILTQVSARSLSMGIGGLFRRGTLGSGWADTRCRPPWRSLDRCAVAQLDEARANASLPSCRIVPWSDHRKSRANTNPKISGTVSCFTPRRGRKRVLASGEECRRTILCGRSHARHPVAHTQCPS